jgi:hypothetical protein
MFAYDNGYDDVNLGFDEDLLPPGQEPILTRNVKKFKLFVRLLIESKQKTGYTAMGVATGRIGVGKTIAILNYLNSLGPRPHTGLPACIGMRVKPDSNPKTLLEDLYALLGEKEPKLNRLNRHKIADEAAKAIIAWDVKLIFFDEADLLGADGFEFLRYIFGKTGCPIVIVGLPRIKHVIKRHGLFGSRVGLPFRFLPPSEQEVLDTILPKLVIPRWVYDSACEADRAMGQELWKKASPSFRELRMFLQFASMLAEKTKAPRITPKVLRKTYQLRSYQTYTEEADEEEEEEDIQSELPLTAYEIESRQRQDAKKRHTQSTDE